VRPSGLHSGVSDDAEETEVREQLSEADGEALRKLEELYAAGVLTQEQYEAELRKLTGAG
jgi:hypothetical protein